MKKKVEYSVGIKFSDEKNNYWIAYPSDAIYPKVKELSDAGKEIIIPQEEILTGWGMRFEKEDAQQEKWNHLKAIQRIKDKIKDNSFPLAKKPISEALDFPEDLTKLNSKQLGELLGKFEAWRSYVHTQLVFLDVERKILTDTYEIGVGKMLFNMEKSSEKKRLKEAMIGFIVSTVPLLRRTKEKIIELDAEYAAFNRIQLMYDNNIFTISREISRRQGEFNISNRVVNLQ